jgi:hypothetical protein
LLLYHFDEGEGAVVRDSSGRGYDGELRGPECRKGKFSGALWFDGKDDSVFRPVPEEIQKLRELTVECWFNQEATSGRRFLVGQDVGFHFEVADGAWAGLSIYNQGGAVPNAEGKPHQQLGATLGSLRTERWHHLAATYDGAHIAFFLDGVLKGRSEAAKDFLLGAPSRGLWIGCYVDMDYYFSGLIDEVRISDCIRYDPERRLQPGGVILEMPRKALPPRAVRVPQQTGLATLDVTLRKLYGGNAAGFVCLKPPGRQAVAVGQYALTDQRPGAETSLSLDVSDEVIGDGCYILGLDPTDTSGYFAVTSAKLTAGGKTLAEWSGDARSRRTFRPPVLVPLQVGKPQASEPQRLLLRPRNIDRQWGELEMDDEDPSGTPLLVGNGNAEFWLNTPQETTYRVYVRYAAGALRPCDIVIDGDDLNPFDMCALNVTGHCTARDAFWEYQGTTTLAPGLHWLRLQDVLPDIVALRLEPLRVGAPFMAPGQVGARFIAPGQVGAPFMAPTSPVPWEPYKIPAPDFLRERADWQAQPQFGQATGTSTFVTNPEPGWRFSATFSNVDRENLFAGDCVRFVRQGQWNLEPFGSLTFRFAGDGTGHVSALWLWTRRATRSSSGASAMSRTRPRTSRCPSPSRATTCSIPSASPRSAWTSTRAT